MSKVIVTFENNWRGYAAGETAGFDTSVAQSLIEGGYAVEAGKHSSKKVKAGSASTGSASKADADSAAGSATSPAAQTGDEGKP